MLKILSKNIFILIISLSVLWVFYERTILAQQFSENRPIPSLKFENAEIRAVLKILASYSEIDIVASEAVKGTVNLTLTQKTWYQALQIIAKIHNLTVVPEEQYLFVLPTADYVKQELETATQEANLQATEGLIRKIIKVDHAPVAAIKTAVTELLSIRGKITSVDRNNSLIILDTEGSISEIEKVIKKLDLETPQITIESRLVQVDSRKLQELGINWTYQNAGSGLNNLSIGSNTADNVANPLVFGTIDTRFLLSTLRYLLSQEMGEELAHPQITTLDNIEANIFMGEQFPQVIADADGKRRVEYIEAGIKLTVTPHITAADRILLKLAPEKKSYFTDPIVGAIIRRQSANTNVVVSNGETAVIGGLVTTTEAEIIKGVPILKDLPLIGSLFRYKRKEIVKRDLIIFVTPHISVPPHAQIQQSSIEGK